MEKYILIFVLLGFVSNKIPEYVEMKSGEKINFTLENANSSFYAYLTWEEDYEEINYKDLYNDIHYIKLNKELDFTYIFSDELPDETSFNKEDYFDYIDLDQEKFKLESYLGLRKNEKNYTLYFEFFIREENIKYFDKKKEFSIEKVIYIPIFKKFDLNFELKPDQVVIFSQHFDAFDYSIQDEELFLVFFSNTNNSFIYERGIFNETRKNSSNHYLYNYYYFYDAFAEFYIYDVLFIIYNSDNYIKNISFSYKIQGFYAGFYNSLDIKYLSNSDNYSIYNNVLALYYIYSNDSSFISSIDIYAEKFIFDDNIEDIKSLDDLKNIKHYTPLSNGIIFSPKNFYIILVKAHNFYLKIKEINFTEKKILDEFNFNYYKLSKNYSLFLKTKNENESIIIKLVSDNNGTVKINDKNYFFNKNDILILEIEKDFNITALDDDLIFAIKLKIPDEFIDNVNVGKNYLLRNNTNYKFIVYELNNQDYSAIKLDKNKDIKYSFDFGLRNIYDMEKRFNDTNLLYLDLSFCNKYKKNASCFLFIYFENINEDNITLTTTNFKPLDFITNEFMPIQGLYLNFYYEQNNENFFAFPCTQNTTEIKNFYAYTNSANMEIKGKNSPFQHSFHYLEIGDYKYPYYLNEFNTYGGLTYITYYRNNDSDFYSYIEDVSRMNAEEYFKYIMSTIVFGPINSTHLRYVVPEFFSNSPEINYYWVITNSENDNLIRPKCKFLNDYYFNNIKERDEFQIYHFSKSDLLNETKNNSIVYYIDLPLPKEINLYRKNLYRLMGITGPKYKYIKMYEPVNYSICYMTCKTCNHNGSSVENQNCTSCMDSNLLVEDSGNCVEKCPLGYYQKEDSCKLCNENCLTCSNEKENDNNNCLTCDRNSTYKYLLNAENFGKNCVEKCPDGTKLDEDNYQCIKDNGITGYIYIIIGVSSFVLVLVIGLFIYILLRRRCIKNNIEKEKISDEIEFEKLIE